MLQTPVAIVMVTIVIVIVTVIAVTVVTVAVTATAVAVAVVIVTASGASGPGAELRVSCISHTASGDASYGLLPLRVGAFMVRMVLKRCDCQLLELSWYEFGLHVHVLV